jgi:hypothetical protein
MPEASKLPETLEAMHEGLKVRVRAYVNACAMLSEAAPELVRGQQSKYAG